MHKRVLQQGGNGLAFAAQPLKLSPPRFHSQLCASDPTSTHLPNPANVPPFRVPQIGVVATHGYRKRTVEDGGLVAWLYARYGRFWLDFVASVPFIYLVVLLAGSFKLNKSWVNCLSLLRLLRMVRLVSISKVRADWAGDQGGLRCD